MVTVTIVADIRKSRQVKAGDPASELCCSAPLKAYLSRYSDLGHTETITILDLSVAIARTRRGSHDACASLSLRVSLTHAFLRSTASSILKIER